MEGRFLLALALSSCNPPDCHIRPSNKEDLSTPIREAYRGKKGKEESSPSEAASIGLPHGAEECPGRYSEIEVAISLSEPIF
jgi:hypothetical protein